MSISTSGGEQRRPSVVSTGGKAPGGSAARGGKSGAPRPGGGGKGPRRPITPVKVGAGRNWGPIAMIGAVCALALGIIGYGVYAVFYEARLTVEDKAEDIKGIVNYRAKDKALTQPGKHTGNPVKYTILPPVGGEHNPVYQNCMGDIYDEPIANEHAVHSLEHGAVWITYRPDLPKDQVEKLAGKVRGKEKMMMSPFPGLDKPISLQAWGFQLKVDNADDPRIDQFIETLRVNASMEGPSISCAGGVTATGDKPRNLPQQQEQPPAGDGQ
ncbi:MAG TPA: DUF3105 domain-containing protein [Pilimelia sp.]|nr:DUF3105 domain-containing protein [Pilimelia sp.]